MSDDHRVLIKQARAEHTTLGGETGHWCRACPSPWPCLSARLAEALEQERAALLKAATYIRELEQERAGAVRCGSGNYGPCGEDVCDATDRELARLARELEVAAKAREILEFSNQILPPAMCDQDRCVACDSMRYQGHAQGCRLAGAGWGGRVMDRTSLRSLVYAAGDDGQVARQYSYAEVLAALQDILPSSESHVESLTYCWGSQHDAELQEIVNEWQGKLRRAYEVAGVEPPEWSVLAGGHRGQDCPCQQQCEHQPPVGEGEFNAG